MLYYKSVRSDISMTKNELINFVKNFNNTKIIPTNVILEGLKELPAKDHQLFMMLVNYKNSTEFKKKLDNGEI